MQEEDVYGNLNNLSLVNVVLLTEYYIYYVLFCVPR